MRVVTCLLVAASVAAGAPAVGAEGPDGSPEALRAAVEQHVRAILEPALRSRAGVGFRTFHCELPKPFEPGSRFHCEAVDEDGDWLGYAIQVDEDGSATVVLASERASALDPDDRATLAAPCARFLEHYQARAWKPLVADLHPALREAKAFAAARENLEDLREVFGAVRASELQLHAVRDTGRQELVYRLECEHGRASVRFGVAPDDDGVWRVIAFLVSATPGSPEQAMLLAREGRASLSRMTGLTVVRVDAPLAQLLRPGDAVEGTMELQEGRRMPILVTQTGWQDDFDPVDYRFSVLDVTWLVHRAVADKLAKPVTVECGVPVVPDGGETECTAVGGDGARLDLVVSRTGGAHRMRTRAPSAS